MFQGVVKLVVLSHSRFLLTVVYLYIVCAGMDCINKDSAFLTCLAYLQLKCVIGLTRTCRAVITGSIW